MIGNELFYDNGDGTFSFYCPGCDRHHKIDMRGWNVSGTHILPTITPGILNEYLDDKGLVNRKCHVFIEKGYLIYSDDTFHNFSGTRIPMEPVKIHNLNRLKGFKH